MVIAVTSNAPSIAGACIAESSACLPALWPICLLYAIPLSELKLSVPCPLTPVLENLSANQHPYSINMIGGPVCNQLILYNLSLLGVFSEDKLTQELGI